LAEIEEKALGGQKLADYCDLVAGTSTGAIIAMALGIRPPPG